MYLSFKFAVKCKGLRVRFESLANYNMNSIKNKLLKKLTPIFYLTTLLQCVAVIIGLANLSPLFNEYLTAFLPKPENTVVEEFRIELANSKIELTNAKMELEKYKLLNEIGVSDIKDSNLPSKWSNTYKGILGVLTIIGCAAIAVVIVNHCDVDLAQITLDTARQFHAVALHSGVTNTGSIVENQNVLLRSLRFLGLGTRLLFQSQSPVDFSSTTAKKQLGEFDVSKAMAYFW